MEKPALIFFVVAVISFVGSLQLGPVNMTVIQTVLRQHLKAGIWVAIGGCLPEMIYAAAAVWFGMWFNTHPRVLYYLEWLAIPILILMGILMLRKPSNPSQAPSSSTLNQSLILKGFWVGVLNPQLFPYWLVVLLQFQGYSWLHIQHFSEQFSFVLGTAFGALGLLVGVAYLTSRFREAILAKLANINPNQILGWFFIGLGMLQLLKKMS